MVDIEQTDPSRFHELRTLAVSVISSSQLDTTESAKKLSQFLMASTVDMFNIKLTRHEKVMAQEIIHDAADLDLILRQSRASFSVRCHHNCKKYRFAYDERFMSLNQSPRRLQIPHSVNIVDLIISPALFKAGNSDGKKYDRETVLVKMNVVCNAINYDDKFERLAEGEHEKSGMGRIEPTSSTLPGGDEPTKSAEKEPPASENEGSSRAGGSGDSTIVDLTQSTPDPKTKSHRVGHEDDGRRSPILGVTKRVSPAESLSSYTAKDATNSTQVAMANADQRRGSKRAMKSEHGHHGKDNSITVKVEDTEQMGGTSMIPQDHTPRAETQGQDFADGGILTGSEMTSRGGRKLGGTSSESSDAAQRPARDIKPEGDSTAAQSNRVKTVRPSILEILKHQGIDSNKHKEEELPYASTTSSETLEADAGGDCEAIDELAPESKSRPSTVPGRESHGQPDGPGTTTSGACETSTHGRRAPGDTSRDPRTARQSSLQPGDIAEAEKRGNGRGGPSAFTTDPKIANLVAASEKARKEAMEARYSLQAKTKQSSKVAGGAGMGGTREKDAAGGGGIATEKNHRGDPETKAGDIGAKMVVEDEEIDQIQMLPQEDDTDGVLPLKLEESLDDAAETGSAADTKVEVD